MTATAGRGYLLRAVCFLVALAACSCATFPQVATCPPAPTPPSTREVVISDIDDTIKVTHVRLAHTHIYNPLLPLDGIRPWRPVTDMVSLYQKKWRDIQKTTVLYVSAGLCYRRSNLERFIQRWGFPKGQIVLRDTPRTLIPPHDYKTKAIYQIIRHWPKHHFVLIGDSGEFDPECYGDLARKFPNQIDRIYIRNISGNEPDRYKWAFRDLPGKYKGFKSPSDIANLK